MTNRIIRAGGTLVAALVIFAGCDAAGPTPDIESAGPSSASLLLDFYVSGPTRVDPYDCAAFAAYASGSTVPVSVTWSLSGNANFTSQTSTTASIETTGVGTFKLAATRAGHGIYTLNGTVSSSGATVC